MSQIDREDAVSHPNLDQVSAAVAQSNRRCLVVSISPQEAQRGEGAQFLKCRLLRVLSRSQSARRQKILIFAGALMPQPVMAEPSWVPTGALYTLFMLLHARKRRYELTSLRCTLTLRITFYTMYKVNLKRCHIAFKMFFFSYCGHL